MTVALTNEAAFGLAASSDRISTWSERVAKIILIASTGLAMVGEVTIAVRYLPSMGWIVPAVAIGILVVARIRLDAAAWPVLGLTFVAPALILVGASGFPAFYVLWYGALLGLIAADREVLRWHVPPSWRPPIACWALVIAFSWPVIVGRELEWDLAHLYRHAIVVTSTGGIARNEVDWIFGVAATYGLGLLWLDWLFSVYTSEAEFRRTILVPVIVSWTIAMLVGVYQLTIDPTLFALGFWVALRRIVGPLLDANGFGMVAALWGAPFAALVLSRPTAIRFVAALLALALSFAGVWGSGSRNAFAVAFCGAVALVVILFRDREFARIRARMAAGFGVVAALLIAAVVLGRIPAIGPLHRIWEFFPGRTPGQFLYQFWDRAQYGSAGIEAIRRWPLAGTGLGTFHTLVADIWFSAGQVRLPPDNAQSWYRHQLAELGTLGSIGWIVWLLLVCAAILTPIRQHTGSVVVRATRVMLILLGLVELVGIPTQVFAVALSFLTILAWHVNSRRNVSGPLPRFRWPRYIWLVVWGIALLHAGLTVAHARGDLRVPSRAVWGKFEYKDGFYPEPPPGTQAGQAKFTERHAVAVLQATGLFLRLSVWLPYPDADTQPVHVDVWVDGQHSINVRLRDKGRVVRYVPVQQGERFVLESKVSRTFHPPGDSREYGLAMQWEFVDHVPQ